MSVCVFRANRSGFRRDADQRSGLEIYLKGGEKRTIKPGAPILDWHFWEGRAVAVHSACACGKDELEDAKKPEKGGCRLCRCSPKKHHHLAATGNVRRAGY
jgi:hypothetical protein